MSSRRLAVLALAALAASCSTSSASSPTMEAGPPGPPYMTDGAVGTLPPDPTHFCGLPGSVVWQATGPARVTGGANVPDMAWLQLPVGFCVHYFTTVPYARQVRLAPGGELFVSSPTTSTTGGGGNGRAAIVVVPDDDKDGVGDSANAFLDSLPSTQGILFANDHLYFQDDTKIFRVPYRAGDRTPSGARELVTEITAPQSKTHWPKNLDVMDDGTLLVTNGGDQADACVSTRPVLGGVFAVDASGTPQLYSRGYRNPIALRCRRGFGACVASELVKDYSAHDEGREKLVRVGKDSDFGYPCCASKDTAYTGTTYGDTGQPPDCSGTAPESDGFFVGHTPFGFDFEPNQGKWPAPFAGRIVLAMHGEFATWIGARLVAIATDPKTGLPLSATEPVDGASSSDAIMQNFATGWDDGQRAHGRPADVTFAPDGRMFVADDVLGVIAWIAPVDLPRPM